MRRRCIQLDHRIRHSCRQYQLAGRRFEALRDVTAIVSNDQGVASVLSSLPNLLGVASSGFSAAMAVFSVMSRAVATWSEIEQRNQRYNKELLIAFNNELSEVARIMQEQQSLLQSAYDIFGARHDEDGKQDSKPPNKWTPHKAHGGQDYQRGQGA